ncbi:PAS domain-containing protein [Rheinheimera sp.]|uniref:PAS domain-containing protein n=1 Tax=Rheinheimera sp. TaxID=1869214 RepID=UPI002733F798|nr:PAS domain-containing protein [Rheinheimera sp.]MDP2715767.1 PAS domain-containing protein [Rheinheimera sp.]
MSDPIIPPHPDAPLRQQAEQQLRSGTAQLSNAFTASADALGVLYRLSSAANTAGDGLKLLHELQIHQVELDLQLEQLQQNERECNHELACYRQFFELAPAGYFILSLDGLITACNAAAVRLFANEAQNRPEQLCGRALLSLFSAACRPMLSATLTRVQRNQQSATLMVSTDAATAQTLRLSAQLSPDHKAILIMLT